MARKFSSSGLYEGYSPTDMETIWSIGATPEDAIRALCHARWDGQLESVLTPLPEPGDPRYTWGYRFKSAGTSFKAAGIFVPGGAICTWWK